MTVPNFIRHLIYRDLERCKKAPNTIRDMTEDEIFESLNEIYQNKRR